MKNTLIVLLSLIMIVFSTSAFAQLGSAQMIKVGNNKSDVLGLLGSPNIVSSTDNGGELWVYDKISTTVEKESSRTGVFKSTQVEKSSSKTMMTTVIFNADGIVMDIKYRSSRY